MRPLDQSLPQTLAAAATQLRRLAVADRDAAACARAAHAVSRAFAAIRHQLPVAGPGLARVEAALPGRVYARQGRLGRICGCPGGDGFDMTSARRERQDLAALCGRFSRPGMVVVRRDDDGALAVDSCGGDGLVRLEAAAVAELFDALALAVAETAPPRPEKLAVGQRRVF